jgi:hypothetical protein
MTPMLPYVPSLQGHDVSRWHWDTFSLAYLHGRRKHIDVQIDCHPNPYVFYYEEHLKFSSSSTSRKFYNLTSRIRLHIRFDDLKLAPNQVHYPSAGRPTSHCFTCRIFMHPSTNHLLTIFFEQIMVSPSKQTKATSHLRYILRGAIG